MFGYILQWQGNTLCKTGKSHTAVSHLTNQSHTACILEIYIFFNDLPVGMFPPFCPSSLLSSEVLSISGVLTASLS